MVAAGDVTPLPEPVGFAAGAAFKSNYTTAYYGLQRGRLKAGEVLLIHGAAGGVGLAAVDMGKLFGATVIATASTEAKLAVCKQMGADHVINYNDGFREQVKDLTDGRGQINYDPVGGDVFDESMRCIAPYGRIIIIGFTEAPGAGQNQSFAHQGRRGHRLHHWRSEPARPRLGAAQFRTPHGLARGRPHLAVCVARIATGTSVGGPKVGHGPQSDGQGSPGA